MDGVVFDNLQADVERVHILNIEADIRHAHPSWH
jgi:hypothetical protein